MPKGSLWHPSCKTPWCDHAFSSLPSAFPIPEGQAGNQPWAIQAAQPWLKLPEVFTEMISIQFKEREHKRDWTLWVLVGPENNSVGMGLVCRQQLYHMSLKDGKGNHSTWLSWRKAEVSTLSFCTRKQRLKRDLCARLMDQALILVHALTLEEVVQPCSHVQMWCLLSHSLWESPYTCISQSAGGWKRNWSLHWNADIMPSLASFGQVNQSCCVLRKTGSKLVFLKAPSCNFQEDFPSSSDTHATGPGQRAGGAMWIMAQQGVRQPCQVSAVGTRGPIGTPCVAGTRGSSVLCAWLGCCGCSQASWTLFNDVSLGTAVCSNRGERSSQCTHVKGLLVLHTTPDVSVQPPQHVQCAPKGSSCPVLHIIGLFGLFSGALSICQGKGLSRHDVKLTSFKSHSALGVITNPGEALSIKHLPCRRVKKICSG